MSKASDDRRNSIECGTAPVEDSRLLDLSFDQYQRHRGIQEAIDAIRWQTPLSILDVGGSPGISKQFLARDRVVVSDVVDSGGMDVFASGMELPFADRSFDLVISSDSLEHIRPGDRTRFLAELVRVSREAVVVGAPFDDPSVVRAEEVLQQLIRARYGEGYHYIEEHRSYGLPGLNETLLFFGEQDLRTAVIPNGYLHRWVVAICLTFLLQWRFHDPELNSRVSAYYNAHFYPQDNREPSYRKIIVAARTRNLAGLSERISSPPPETETDWLAHLQALDTGVHALTENWSEYAQELEGRLEERTRWALDLERESALRNDRILELERELEGRTRWALELDVAAAERLERVLGLQGEIEVLAKWGQDLEKESALKSSRIRELEELLEERTRWSLRLDQEISALREDHGRLTEALEGRERDGEATRELRDTVGKQAELIVELLSASEPASPPLVDTGNGTLAPKQRMISLGKILPPNLRKRVKR